MRDAICRIRLVLATNCACSDHETTSSGLHWRCSAEWSERRRFNDDAGRGLDYSKTVAEVDRRRHTLKLSGVAVCHTNSFPRLRHVLGAHVTLSVSNPLLKGLHTQPVTPSSFAPRISHVATSTRPRRRATRIDFNIRSTCFCRRKLNCRHF